TGRPAHGGEPPSRGGRRGRARRPDRGRRGGGPGCGRRARRRRLRMSPRRAVAAAAFVLLLAGCGSRTHAPVRQARVAAVTLLPDLVERPPAALIGGVVRFGGRDHYSVGFDTTVVNRRRGIMLVQGHRLRGQPRML